MTYKFIVFDYVELAMCLDLFEEFSKKLTGVPGLFHT